MKINKRCVALLLWLLLVPQAHAEQGNPSQTPWYTIELVVFTRSTPPQATGEIWSQASKELNWRGERAGNYPAAAGSSWQLTGAKQALSQSRGLTPVIHTAWRQPVYSRKSARPFYLRSEREIAPGTPLVEGMVKVSVSRYLHVDLDLLMRGAPSGPQRLPGGFQTFHFDEHRRMRSKELHYIDHPLLGMLIQITPLDTAGSLPTDEGGVQESADSPVTEEPAKQE